MAVYHPRQRRSPWVWVVPLLLVVLILVAGGLWAARLARPSPEAQIGQAAQRMSGQLDVLRVSHYTP